ncbi:MAG: aspartyl protease family protein [Anaerolinea sp.]|nr:aspartyl protease family protein [Anaerolinea sp.]
MAVYSHDYDGDVYDPAAPIVEIVVSHTSPGGLAETLSALVDSGADATMLPINILTRVGARFLETRQMRGVTGHRLVVDTYLVTIRLGPHTLHGIQSVAMREGIEAVVGRDVLNQLEVVLNGPANVVEIVA